MKHSWIIAVLPLFLMSQHSTADDLTLLKCRTITNSSERLECYDQVTQKLLDKSGNNLSAESLFGKKDNAYRKVVSSVLGVDTPESSLAKVTKLNRSSLGRLLIELDNEQLWQQTNNRRLALSTGDSVIIKRGTLGSYFLHKEDSKAYVRVKRIN